MDWNEMSPNDKFEFIVAVAIVAMLLLLPVVMVLVAITGKLK